ncbi:potassium ion transporter, variant [Blastomyces gilchristii SLH14081]|uniref:Potassium transport protein n=1 Tax=Blastomyces gilchristii (strain SLH14081) TaxID=559298 RepID=A0A179UAV6_BLAGS|nr:potassium ion transporter, variant [Blastomyces gilchristii SLH14081]XP_031576527.1 potassium ion transporter [Blastomyces gilchristii SLH14081]OAT05074.1 potassium ion transporter [Blastomyces gilchristii SLH14081]OAT05075.1 potassium ion transporter, variant [Blastomyces gilchristii SLH14081]
MTFRSGLAKVRRAYWSLLEGFMDAIQVLDSIRSRIPVISSIRINFLSLHYAYIIVCALACSIVIYPNGNMRYIDALLFGTGSATQSGLNPIDLNLLFTYQQVGLWFVSMITNPIVIHSFVVFMRLFWFERRFQHVVREAKTLRRIKTRQRTMTRDAWGREGVETGPNQDREGVGVRGKRIVLVRDSDTGQAQGGSAVPDVMKKSDPESTSDSDKSPKSTTGGRSSSQMEDQTEREERGELANTSESPVADDNDRSVEFRTPQYLSPEHHIAFLEHQRRQTGALRIPSPREYDRGRVPQTVDNTDGGDLTRAQTSQSERPLQSSPFSPFTPPSRGRRITIDEPNAVRMRSRTRTFPRTNSRRGRSQGASEPDTDYAPSERTRKGTLSSLFRSTSAQGADVDSSPYLSWQPTIGRNSAFVDLTEEQRNELGGIEYRALKALAVVLICYFFLFHLLGIICLVPWILKTERFGNVVRAAGVGRPWWAIFTSGSSFNDQGFALTPNSMIPFYDAVFPLLLLTFLIIIGNTGFPCMLRFIIWVLSLLVPTGSPAWEELRFLLDHPRRCFTLLFPRAATWWLFGVLVILNGVDVIFFIILDLSDPDITRIPGGIRFVDGLFQAAATRTAGLAVVNLSEIHPAVQVSYMIMMYISVFPIAISVRRTNVYEEGSLGIYSYPDEDEDETLGSKKINYVGAHLRRQLSFDLWYIFLGLFIIAIVEGNRLDDTGENGFTLFAVMFEIISAYGTVGLSLGFPNTNTSLCAQFKPLSKLIIIAMEIRGRHRGLPYELDRAIMLPSESLNRKELLDANKRVRRSGSAASTFSGVIGQQPLPNPLQQESGSSSAYQRDGPASPRSLELTNRPTGAASNRPPLETHHEDV